MDDQMKAAAYSQMYGTWAFQDFLAQLKIWTEDAANKAAELTPDNSEHFRAYFLSWQERKKLYDQILHHIEESKQILKEQNDDERPHPAYSPRTDSGADLRGY